MVLCAQLVSLWSKCFFFIHLGVERRYEQGGKHLGERGRKDSG